MADPEFTDTARAALMWVLWHHQGGSSPTGQAVRFALGMGQFDRMTADQVAQAQAFAPGIPGLAHTDRAGVALPREPERDYCTDPSNCKRCKAPTWDQLNHEHAGIPQGTQRTRGVPASSEPESEGKRDEF